MARFDTFFVMTPPDVAAFAAERLRLFEPGAALEVTEIGDGNLNYVFRVVDRRSGRSVIVKQAGPTARVSDAFKVSPDRSRIEHEALRLQGELAPGLVPAVHGHDPVLQATVMEDLSDHVILRRALLAGRAPPRLADDLSTFLARTLLLTSDAAVDHKEKRRRAARFVNPDLCEITEDLVFTEPFNDLRGRNDAFPATLPFVRSELYEDPRVRLETAKLKFEFLEHGQSLIHGDLHTGSIFVRDDSTKVIDAEFACHGPAGFDLGMLAANLVFAWANAQATIEEPAERDRRCGWLARTLAEVVDGFVEKWQQLWDSQVVEPTARYPGFAEWYLGGVLRDAAGAAGVELCRRTVGFAKVADLTGIGDVSSRASAERLCIALGKRLILERWGVRSGRDYLMRLDGAAALHPVLGPARGEHAVRAARGEARP